MPLTVSSDLLQEFVRSFSQCTGLPLHFHAPGAYSVGEDPLIPVFCRVMAHGRKACSQCLKTHGGLEDPAGEAVRTATCFAGLTSSAVPLKKKQKILGYLHTGHSYVDRPSGCAQPGRGCFLPNRAHAGLPCAGACKKTPHLTVTEYQGALGLIKIFSRQYLDLYDETLTSPPYPAIDHVVRQIRSDVSRRWTLGELARQAGMHPAYFSEKFHLRTGRTLTSFLAEMRIDKARQLLEFTALPVSEIAFASGFRSLSQFNRVFKKLTGNAPSLQRKSWLDGRKS